MKIKILIFSSLFFSINTLIKCSEQEFKQQKKQTNYEKLLANFPNIEPDLEKAGITEDDLNKAPRFSIQDEMGFFRKYVDGKSHLVIIKKSGSNSYTINIRKPVEYSAS